MPSPQTLAQFEILEELGEGELGTIYKARDSAGDREVEIEVLPASKSLDIDRLRQEVNAARALDHWSIAKIFELARSGDTDFLVREHVPGRKLAGPLPYPAALDCARQIAGALAAGHSIGVTHRHLSAGNIFLSGESAVKLVNFGLTPQRPDIRYLAPEQVDGRGADARADIYSFGKVLREIAGPAAPKPLEKIIDRCTQRNVGRRYQLMEDIQQALDHLASPSAADAAEPGRRLLLVVGAAVVAIVAIGWWTLGGRAAIHRGPAAVTSDSGLTTEGTVSPDGRVVAYASDRTSPGVLHIWTQPVSGGSPTRLTDGADDDHEPAIASDNAHVVFRSERDGGGLYLVPAAGGVSQFLVKGGRDPRYSPDGRWIAYWVGDPLTPNGALWVIASSGGLPRQLRQEFADARFPIWSPDGKYLLFVGNLSAERRGPNRDWYITPFSNGSSDGRVVRTGAVTLLHMQAFRDSAEGYSSGAFAIPEAWTGGQVLFAGRMTPMGPRNGGPPHILRIPIDPGILEATGAAHEVTTGSDAEAHPSAAIGGRLVFTRRAATTGVWSVAPDGSGDLRRLTPDIADANPSVSVDGKRLAYRFRVPNGHDEIRVIDLDTGKQVARIQANLDQDGWPLLSPAGDKVVYAARGLFQVSLADGKPEAVNRRRGGWDRVTSWSADGKRVLVQRGWRGFGILNLDSGEERDFLRSDRNPIMDARFSPDGKWVAFTVAQRPHPQIHLAPAGDGADTSWIDLTDEDVSSVSPAWSADGNQIYFLQECQGVRCIWARRFDARRGQPTDEPFPVRHFHHARWSLLPGVDPQNIGLVAARDKLVFGMFENTGNIWSLSSLPRP